MKKLIDVYISLMPDESRRFTHLHIF